jgi:hypothetical protein
MVVFVDAVNTYSDCTDECHGGLFFALAVVALAVLGFLLLAAGVALLGQLDGARRSEINRELNSLRARLTPRERR